MEICKEMVSGRTRTTSTGAGKKSESVLIDPQRRLLSYEKPVSKLFEKDLSTMNKARREPARSYSADVGTSNVTSDLGYATESLHRCRLSERSMSMQSENCHLTHSTPSNASYDSGFGYKYGVQNTVSQKRTSSSNSHTKGSVWDRQSTRGDSSSLWEDKTYPAWGNHHNSKKHVAPPSTPVSKQSPIRESLDSRIELLLKQAGGINFFLDHLAVTSQVGEASVDDEKNLMEPPSSWAPDAPPLPPDSAPLPPLPDSDEPPPPPPPEEDDDLVLLSTPPSPFLNFSEYHKWAVITSDIDSGKLTSLSDIAKLEDSCLENRKSIKGLRLSSINRKANSLPLKKQYDSPIMQDKGFSTTVSDKLPLEVGDKMPLSSLSDGENKLEVHIPGVHDNSALLVTSQKPVKHTQRSSGATSNFSSLYSSQTAGSCIYPMQDSVLYSASLSSFTSSRSALHPPPGSASTGSTPYPPLGSSATTRTVAYPSDSNKAKSSSYALGQTTPFVPSTSFPPRLTLPATVFPSSCVPFASPSNIAEMVIKPMPPSSLPLVPTTSQFAVPPPDIKDLHAPTVDGVVASVIKELKQVMKKDICKRMVEITAFERFEQWWDQQLQTEKMINQVLLMKKAPGPKLVLKSQNSHQPRVKESLM